MIKKKRKDGRVQKKQQFTIFKKKGKPVIDVMITFHYEINRNVLRVFRPLLAG